MATNINKIDCYRVKMLFYELHCQGQVSAPASMPAKTSELKLHRKKVTIKYAFPAFEVHGEKASLDLLDIRTYICAWMAYATYNIITHIDKYQTITRAK